MLRVTAIAATGAALLSIAAGCASEVTATSEAKYGEALACLGTSAPLVLEGGLPYAKARVGTGGAEGAFLLDLGTTRSTIDLAAFGASPPEARDCDPSFLGETCTFDAFDLFGPWGRVVLRTADHAGGDGVRQAGILGTDFFSTVATTLDYRHGRARRAFASTLCTDAELTRAGLAPLSSAGFFASDTARLRPLSDVVAGAAAGTHVPNVPTVPLRIGVTTAPAQLDTGFGDALHPYSVNVNQAFHDAIERQSPGALVRTPSRDVALTTCAGIAEHVDAYVLATGSDVALVDALGGDALVAVDPTIFVKRTPDAARHCGGIGTWSAPAAQIGASFFVRLGLLVFDPFAGRVWVTPAR